MIDDTKDTLDDILYPIAQTRTNAGYLLFSTKLRTH